MLIKTLLNKAGDTRVMCGRVLRHNLRSIDTIITVVAMPVMMMLASVYIYGGAMDIGMNYKNYIVPGILLFCIVSGVAYTSYRLNIDVTKGIFERFHSMPISKSSILGGHVWTTIIFSCISVFVVLLVSMLIGFRPAADLPQWLLAVLLILVFTFAMTWIAIFFGLICRTNETAGIFTYILMGLIFTSSGFAPTNTMPAGLAAFAKHQPMTPVIDGLRGLMLGQKIDGDLWIAFLYCVVIWALFRVLSMKAYKQKMK